MKNDIQLPAASSCACIDAEIDLLIKLLPRRSFGQPVESFPYGMQVFFLFLLSQRRQKRKWPPFLFYKRH